MPATPYRRRRAWPASAAVALAFLVALAGCGSAGPRRLDSADASSLERMLATVRAGAQHGERAAVLTGLAALRARVQRLAASHALAADDAHFLRSDIAAAAAAAERELVPPARAAAALRVRSIVTAAPHPGHGHGKHPPGHKDHGPGHGGPKPAGPTFGSDGGGAGGGGGD